MCMHISLRPGYVQIYETSVRFFNVCHPIELKCDFSIINEFNSNRIKLQKFLLNRITLLTIGIDTIFLKVFNIIIT